MKTRVIVIILAGLSTLGGLFFATQVGANGKPAGRPVKLDGGAPAPGMCPDTVEGLDGSGGPNGSIVGARDPVAAERNKDMLKYTGPPFIQQNRPSPRDPDPNDDLVICEAYGPKIYLESKDPKRPLPTFPPDDLPATTASAPATVSPPTEGRSSVTTIDPRAVLGTTTTTTVNTTTTRGA